MSLEDYGAIAPEESGIRYSESLTHEAGVSLGKWQRSQQCSYRIRAIAAELDDAGMRSILETLASEIELGR